MGANELSAAFAAAQPLLEKLVALGLPGIVCIILALPMLAIMAAFVSAFILNARHAKRMETMLTAYREDTQKILDDLGAKHGEVVFFYQKNVGLVKSYEKLAESMVEIARGMQTIIVNNTRAVEHLSTIIEARGGN